MRRIWLSDMLGSIADRGRELLGLRPSGLPRADHAAALCRKLLSEQGEASGTAIAREVVEFYRKAGAAERHAFIEMLCHDFAPDRERILKAADAYRRAPGLESFLSLSAAVEPPRQELLRRINMAPGGTATIIALREALLELLPGRPELKALDADIKHLLASWFNRGFLQIERIDWHSSALILEKLIAYEAVHAIDGWGDLRRRLAADRRCFAFFHPALRDEPLIFVEVALGRGIATAIGPLIDPAAPEGATTDADTAIFYSISNCQAGLRGISFGNFLIKQVVEELKRELPRLAVFATLSPVPGFHAWLDQRLAEGARGLLTAEERQRLIEAAGRPGAKGAFKALLAMPDWPERAAVREALRVPLLRLCARYLAGGGDRKVPQDPVARFHLGNGARIEQIDWLADHSEKGLRQSCGLMVNYRYELSTIEENHEAFVRDGRVASSSAVQALLAARGPRRLALPASLAVRRRRGAGTSLGRGSAP